ncbi:MAG: NUDIX hydrolase [Promethearchaeota archaeon]
MLVFEGKFINVVQRNGWEFVERRGVTDIVGILAITDDHKMILIEQYREPIQKICIEIPAGLVDDQEPIQDAANRELLEETGYEAKCLQTIGSFPLTPGMTSEIMTIIMATELVKKGEGGGVDADEDIKIIEIPLITSPRDIMKLAEDGQKFIDCKVFLAAYFVYLEITRRISDGSISSQEFLASCKSA